MRDRVAEFLSTPGRSQSSIGPVSPTGRLYIGDPRLTLESLASREGKSERSIRMTLPLAFLAPDIVKAAVEGRLPRGFGLKRLVDLPMAWLDQWRALGLQAPARA